MVHEVEAPLFYVLRRGLDKEQIEAVRAVLSITPCQAVFISNIKDHDLAWTFSDQIFNTDSEESALTLAKECAERIGRPMLVIGSADLLDAGFSDGRREAMEVHVGTS